MTRSSLTVPAPWRELSQASGSQRLIAGSSHAICLWELDLSASPPIATLRSWELPVPGVYRHIVHPRSLVISSIERSSGGSEVGISSLGETYRATVADQLGVVVDLDRSSSTDNVARWLGTSPHLVDLLPIAELGLPAGVGRTIDLSPQLAPLFPGGAEISQLCLFASRLGVLAQSPGSPSPQALILVDFASPSAEVVQTGLANSEVAVNHDTVVWSTQRNYIPFRPDRSAVSDYLLWYLGPYSGGPELLFDVQQRGMEYRSPFLQNDVLVFTQSWPPTAQQPRSLRKTAVHAYPLAGIPPSDAHCTELSDNSVWSEDIFVTSMSRLTAGRALVCFPSKPAPGTPPIWHTQAAIIDF